MSHMTKLKSSTALPIWFGAAGLAMSVAISVQASPQLGSGAENRAARPAAGHMQLAASCNPCRPRGCNPCAAKSCNPCATKNPCAAKGCNPCAAGACNPCNPCGAAAGIEVSDSEAADAYGGIKAQLKAAYGDAGYLSWKSYNKTPYVSGTHGSRYVNNYGNRKAFKYGRFENAGTMTVGSVLAKDSFVVMPNGQVAIGPLFLMEKMGKGFAPNGGDWKYTMIVPGAGTVGVSGGKGSRAVQFCADCHAAVEEQDYLFFLPEEYRKK